MSLTDNGHSDKATEPEASLREASRFSVALSERPVSVRLRSTWGPSAPTTILVSQPPSLLQTATHAPSTGSWLVPRVSQPNRYRSRSLVLVVPAMSYAQYILATPIVCRIVLVNPALVNPDFHYWPKHRYRQTYTHHSGFLNYSDEDRSL